jgi:pimeloyl-ACP methyl ester carboxylesterase
VKPLRYLLLLLLCINLSLAGQPVNHEQSAQSATNGCVIIFLHGKGGVPEAEFLQDFYADLRGDGYKIVTPVMPWSRLKREGSIEDAFNVIDTAAAELGKQNDKIFLAGHSMGAVIAMIYASRKPAHNVQGVIAIAPAHMPRLSSMLSEITRDSVQKARGLARQGKNKQRHSFMDLNKGTSYEMQATVEHYLSFYDPDSFPRIEQVLPEIRIPVVWISAADDRLTYVYRHESLYQRLPANNANRYLRLAGGHKSVLDHAAIAIDAWLKGNRYCK